jgi:hypothetical protein
MSQTLAVMAAGSEAVTAATASASGSAMCTRARAATNACEMAKPMPPAPPVTSTRWGLGVGSFMVAS